MFLWHKTGPEKRKTTRKGQSNDFTYQKNTSVFFSTSPLMFKVPQAHNSHRKLFINGLKTKIGENLRSGSHHKCVLFSSGLTVVVCICIYIMHTCTYIHTYITYIHVLVHVVHVHTYIHVCMYVYMFFLGGGIRIRHVCTYIHTCMHTYMTLYMM